MPKGTIKADVMWRLDGWVNELEPPTLVLTGSENELPVETAIIGTIEVTASRFYQIMKAQKTAGKLPLFRMIIIDPDADVKRDELDKLNEEKKDSPELPLKEMKDPKSSAPKKKTKKTSDKKPKIADAASKDDPVKKFLTQATTVV